MDLLQESQFVVKRVLSQSLEKITCGGPVWFFYGGGSAGQGQVLKMPHSLETLVISDQKFASPDAPVAAVSRAVQSHADDRRIDCVVRHTANDVGVMMLNRDELKMAELAAQFKSIFSGKVFWMQVIGNGFRLYTEKLFIQRQCILEMFQCFQIFHVADVLADECIVVFG